MSEITIVRDSAIIAAEINTIKNRTKREVLAASIEIGQKLCEAKELVQHGDWEQWLHDQVDYSQSTANNLMRIYKEYGDNQLDLLGNSKSQTFANLTYSQAIALFALPAEDREEFVQENPVEDMSVSQLEKAIQAQKDADAARTEAENKLQGTEKLLKKAKSDKDRLEQALKNSDTAKAEAERKYSGEIKKLKEKLVAAADAEPAPPSPEELEKQRAAVKAEVEAEYKKQAEQLTLEKKTADEEKAELKKKYEEKLKQLKLDNESILARQQESEKKLALSAPEIQKFSVYFENFQRDFQSMQDTLKELTHSGNTEAADKLRGALKELMQKLSERLT